MKIDLSVMEAETIISALEVMGDKDNTGTRELLLVDLKEMVAKEKNKQTALFPWRRLWPF